jgi:transglutaminase-like putative cysteine protease
MMSNLGDVGTEPPCGPMDFAAYLGARWYTFDARSNKPRIRRALIGRGRDACDVALSSTFGANKLESFRVWIAGTRRVFRDLPPL